MNRFIKARNNCIKEYNPDKDQSFNEYYLLQYNNTDIYGQNELIQQLNKIRNQQQSKTATEKDLYSWLEELGQNPYLNRAIIDLLIQNKKINEMENLEQKIQEKLLQKNQDHTILFHLLDYCIETKAELLNVHQLENLIQTHRYNYDLMKQLVDYVDCFQYEGLEELLEGLLKEPYFENLKLLVIGTLINLQCSRNSHASIINRLMTLVANEQNPQVFRDYFDYRLENVSIIKNTDCLTIVQTMFYGDPYSLGIGNSGGLGLLLKNIGNHLAKSNEIDKIITLTVSRKLDFGWKLMEKAAPNHYVFRIPIDLDSDIPADFATKELMIKRTIIKHLRCLGIKPDIFHIRYLDNASLAVAKASLELQTNLVFTITPDPHRNLVEKTGSLKTFTEKEALTLSNKIYVGDQLLCLSQGVLGIGGTKIRNELRQYFPQLRYGQNNFIFQMIGEGIETDFNYLSIDLKNTLCNSKLRHHLDENQLKRPIILNVGRLSRLKGQDQLLTAWGESKLHQNYNLLLIGGDSNKPTKDEKYMLDFFDSYLKTHPKLKGNFVHLDALSNEMVRSLENAFLKTDSGTLPNIFVSSSKKEEFGLSILEALGEGWLVFAPTKGGVRTYLKHGVNGFLINTSSDVTIVQDLEKILFKSDFTLEDYSTICEKGRATVTKRYSIDKVVFSFLDFYKKVKAGSQ